jgi:hypothetical protein
VDGAGNAYVAGHTSSTEKTFPVKVGPDLKFRGKLAQDEHAFVAKVDPRGAALIYCGYIAGNGWERGQGVAVDAAGNAYVVGSTTSTEQTFPVTVGPDLTFNGGALGDAFVAKVALTLLGGSGTTRPGGTVSLLLTASDDVSLPYQLGSSLGTGPIPIDKRQLGLSPDDLLVVTANDYWPAIFSGYRGVIGANGQARAAIHIPNITALVGVTLHSAFVTISPPAPSGIKSISNTFSFRITR